MEYRKLGKSGLFLSALSYGSWVTFKNQVNTSLGEKLMGMAYEAGVNFFDNAEVYAQGESEEIMGSSLKKLNWGRDTYCVMTNGIRVVFKITPILSITNFFKSRIQLITNARAFRSFSKKMVCNF